MEHPFCASALHEAVLNGDMAVVEKALENDYILEERSRSMTPLQSAANSGHYDLFPILISKGANVNAPPSEFGCALQATITALWFKGIPDTIGQKLEGHAREKRIAQGKAVDFLLSQGAEIAMCGGEFGHPLAAAAAFGNLEIVKLLLTSGADPNCSGGRLGTVLQAAFAHGGMPVDWCISLASPEDYTQIQHTLLQAGSRINDIGGIYGTALEAAAFVGDSSGVSRLLVEGAEPNIAAGKYGSALGAAARQGHLNVVNILLAAGARSTADRSLRHPNDRWHQWRDKPISSMLSTYGTALPSATLPSEEQVSTAAETPLDLARSNGHMDIVQVLLQR